MIWCDCVPYKIVWCIINYEISWLIYFWSWLMWKVHAASKTGFPKLIQEGFFFNCVCMCVCVQVTKTGNILIYLDFMNHICTAKFAFFLCWSECSIADACADANANADCQFSRRIFFSLLITLIYDVKFNRSRIHS